MIMAAFIARNSEVNLSLWDQLLCEVWTLQNLLQQMDASDHDGKVKAAAQVLEQHCAHAMSKQLEICWY